MPTYEYVCTNCDTRIEVVQAFSDDPLTVCDDCSGTLRKVFSPVGVVFKGSGFYRTDSRAESGSGKGRAATPASTGSGGAPATAGDGGSESSQGAKTSAEAADRKPSPAPPSTAAPTTSGKAGTATADRSDSG